MKFSLFSLFPDVYYGISERADGPMKLRTGDASVCDARAMYFAKQHIDSTHVVSASLVHGKHIERVVFVDGGKVFEKTDGLVTQEGETFLSVTVADCVPVYFFDPVARVVGIVHAGWRGVISGIVPEMTRMLKDNYGCVAANILVGIGPSIRSCHFEITSEIRDQFPSFVVEERDGRTFVDLVQMIVHQLRECGVRQIEDSQECTFCSSDRYFSYRRDKPAQVEAMIAWIGISTAL